VFETVNVPEVDLMYNSPPFPVALVIGAPSNKSESIRTGPLTTSKYANPPFAEVPPVVNVESVTEREVDVPT